MRNPVLVVPDTNRAVQPNKMARGLTFKQYRDCTIDVTKTKALISWGYAKAGFFMARLILYILKIFV